MKEFFKKLFGKKDKTIVVEKPVSDIKHIEDLKVLDENGNPENEFLTAAINQCYRTGKPVIGNVDSDGKMTFKNLD